jgi:nitrogen fixation NifU-like protein
MQFSDKMMEHFENPRNVGSMDEQDATVGTATITAGVCGDVTKLHLKIEDGVIVDVKFKTFGCAAAIASGSLATEWLKGKTVDEAREIRNAHIAQQLELPPSKVHCSVLTEDAVKAALEDYAGKNGS